MSVGGTKDGLMRISRMSESFWHTNINIDKSQYQMFPTVAFEGVSHSQFMDDDVKIPITVRNKDLKADISYSKAHSLVGESIARFLDQIIGGKKASLDTAAS